MKAWRVCEYGEPNKALRLVDVPIPNPGPGHIVVKVSAVALNFPDVLLCRGTYQWQPEIPFTPGLEVCGQIIAVGDDVSRQIGERVFGGITAPHGGLAEYAVMSEAEAFPVPEGMSDSEAAGFYITYHSAFVGLRRRADVRAGESLLVLAGAGGVGSAAIQVGLACGARVIAAAGGAGKTQICRELGAHEVIDYQQADLVQEVRALTDGRGVDVIWDPVGGDMFAALRRCVAFEGRIVLVGFASGNVPDALLAHALLKNYSLVGLHWGLYRRGDSHYVHSVHKELTALYEAGKIRPLISAEPPLREAPEWITRLAAGKTHGKVVLRPHS